MTVLLRFQESSRNLILPPPIERCETITEVYDSLNFEGFKDSRAFDDANSLIFARELTKIQAQTMDVQYDDLKAREMFDFDTSGGEGLTSIIQRFMDKKGSGIYVDGESTDIPSADVQGSEHEEPVRAWSTHVSWSVQDMKRSQRVGLPLSMHKFRAAQYVGETEIEVVASVGRPKKQLRGLFYDTSILTSHTLPADGTGTKKAFSTKTGDKIVRDVRAMYGAQIAACRGKAMFLPDTWVGTPGAHFALSTPNSTTDATPAIDIIRKGTNIQNFIAWPALYDILGGKDAMFIFKKSPDVASFKLPAPLMPMPVEYCDRKFKVYFDQEIGGLHLNYPYTICYAVED